MTSKTSSLCCVLAVSIGTVTAYAADKPSPKNHEAATSHAALGPAETLTGKIVMVDTKSNLLVIKNAEGTTFDLVVNKATHLQSASSPVHMNDLNGDINKPVSIIFIPERSGDIARSIKLTS